LPALFAVILALPGRGFLRRGAQSFSADQTRRRSRMIIKEYLMSHPEL